MFDDFDKNELGRIWTGMRKEKLWEEDDGVCSVVVKRMVKMSGRKGFGNAREVRKRLEAATQTAMVRLDDRFEPETMRLEIEDVIGKDPLLESEKLVRVMDELEGKIGWSSVKKTVGELIELCSVNYQRELLGKKPFDLGLNRLFLGNPGTALGSINSECHYHQITANASVTLFISHWSFFQIQALEKHHAQGFMAVFSRSWAFLATVMLSAKLRVILLEVWWGNHKRRRAKSLKVHGVSLDH
jgi:AAA lid domain